MSSETESGETESSETEDLVQDYLDEDPSILTEDELQAISARYDLGLEKTKVLAKEMSRARSEARTQSSEQDY